MTADQQQQQGQPVGPMAAGPELDVLVERQIFARCGHVPFYYARDRRRDDRDYSDYATLRCRRCKVELRGLMYRVGIPVARPFSSRVADAMTLLESWHGDWNIRRQNDHYEVTLYEPSMQGSEWAETLPLAICRMRLRAAGWNTRAAAGHEQAGDAT